MSDRRWTDPEGVEWEVTLDTPDKPVPVPQGSTAGNGPDSQPMVVKFRSRDDPERGMDARFPGSTYRPASSFDEDELLRYWQEARRED